MVKLNIRLKLLLLIMAATIIPLLALNIFWTNSQRQALIKSTQTRQTLVTSKDASDVNNFLNDKVRALIIHSQSISLEQASKNEAELELKTLLYEDKDLTRVSLVNKAGQETVAVTTNGASSPLQNVSQSTTFHVINYYAGNQYISPVTLDTKGNPMITIAVPIVNFTTPQNLANLSTAEPGVILSGQAINGALIAQVDLKDLWSSVLSNANNVGDAPGGYAYVVDSTGTVIAYPGSISSAPHYVTKVPIVATFLKQLSSTTTSGTLQNTSEKNVPVLATYQRIPVTNWGIIFEDPISSIYQDITAVSYIGIALSAVAILGMSGLSIFLSRLLSRPIVRIARVAEQIGQGDFGAHLDEKRTDEIGLLSQNINAMGQNLGLSIGRIDAQRRQLEAILNNTTDSIVAVNEQGFIIIANHAASEFFESTTQALFGQDIRALLTLSQQTKPFVIDYSSIEPGSHIYRNLEYKSPAGLKHFIDVVAFKIIGSGDTVASQTIITIHDETKNRELDSMKLDFVSMAAHELRTPLSAVQGYLELMSIDPQFKHLPEKTQRYLTQAKASSNELTALIGNLLSVSHIERGTLKLVMGKADFAAVARKVTQDLHFNAEVKDITLSYVGPETDRFVIADTTSLKEVINNIIDNAIKYTPRSGAVTVSFGEESGAYVVHIKDTGQGIPKNALPYLFTKFYRVHGGLESGSAGTGLGLFIAKSIITDHNGTITVDSTEGEGAEFSIRLPLFDEARLADIQKTTGNTTVAIGGKRGWTTKNINR